MRLPLISSMIALGMALSACNAMGSDRGDDGAAVSDDPTPSSHSYALSGFTGVTLAGPDHVVIRHGDSFSVTATGPKSALDRLEIAVDDGALEVKRRSGSNMWGSSHGVATITVTMPTLSTLVIAGSGDGTADAMSGDKGKIVVAGSGDATVTGLAVKALDLNIAGSGDISATGTAESADVTVAGSGGVNAPQLTASSAELSVIGSGDIAMAVHGNAAVSIAGSGDVTVTGGAHCTTSRVGSGSVTCS